ncbi:hypothetical protein Acsp03_55800 [Actinomadura sp. NBRC 104412]|nr:hypothetical protein Acsp03_55800 [Actinomadura sp. NBRC 104412]
MPTKSHGANGSSSHSLCRPIGRSPPMPSAARNAAPTETSALGNGGTHVLTYVCMSAGDRGPGTRGSAEEINADSHGHAPIRTMARTTASAAPAPRTATGLPGRSAPGVARSDGARSMRSAAMIAMTVAAIPRTPRSSPVIVATAAP